VYLPTSLYKIYSEELVDEVIEDMHDPERIFKSYNLNSYFHCIECDISKFDYYPVAVFLKKMEEIQLSNPVNQINLSKVFYS
jgi:hypothetical protein